MEPARAIQRLRAPLRWPQEEYNKVVSGPNGLYAVAELERIENAGPAPVAPPSAEQERLTRGSQIRMGPPQAARSAIRPGTLAGALRAARTPRLAWSATEASSAFLRKDAFAWSVPHEDWVYAFLRLSSRAPQRLRRTC